jgi:hypothetical protein
LKFSAFWVFQFGRVARVVTSWGSSTCHRPGRPGPAPAAQPEGFLGWTFASESQPQPHPGPVHELLRGEAGQSQSYRSLRLSRSAHDSVQPSTSRRACPGLVCPRNSSSAWFVTRCKNARPYSSRRVPRRAPSPRPRRLHLPPSTINCSGLPPSFLASSPPRLLASSPPRLLASSRPHILASLPPRLLASSPPRLLTIPHLLASSPPRLLASSPSPSLQMNCGPSMPPRDFNLFYKRTSSTCRPRPLTAALIALHHLASTLLHEIASPPFITSLPPSSMR